MKNRAFHFELRKLKTPAGERLTVERIAAAIMVNRAHLVAAINNRPGRGGNTRWKVARYLKEHYPASAASLLQSLHWNEQGEIVEQKPNVATATFHST